MAVEDKVIMSVLAFQIAVVALFGLTQNFDARCKRMGFEGSAAIECVQRLQNAK